MEKFNKEDSELKYLYELNIYLKLYLIKFLKSRVVINFILCLCFEYLFF